MISIYCDGSRTETGAYIGLHISYSIDDDCAEIMEAIGDYSSSTAEIVAIYRAVELAMKTDQQVVIYTEMVGMAEANHFDINRLNRLINSKDWMKVLQGKIAVILTNFPRITLKYIKAHSGDLHNSRADRLARGARTMEWPLSFKEYRKVFQGYDGIVKIRQNKIDKYFSNAFFRRMLLG